MHPKVRHTMDKPDINTTASHLQLQATCSRALTHRLGGYEDVNYFKRVLTADEALAKLAHIEDDAWIESLVCLVVTEFSGP